MKVIEIIKNLIEFFSAQLLVLMDKTIVGECLINDI